MSEALYRKYRPQTFAQVVGQEVVSTILQNALATGRVSHAYLFTGPRGVGKTTVARILAKAVNCLDMKDGEPCTTCVNCQLIQTGRFLDLIEIDAASYTGVDNIREIIDHVKFPPNIGRYKVFIIDEVHMLSKAAFNALLKTLEEPPSHVIFILATTEIQKVPATIISRSQRFDFGQIGFADILKVLDLVLSDLKVNLSLEAKTLVARASGGSLRDALSILDQLLSMGQKELQVEEVEEILGIVRLQSSQTFFDFLSQGRAQEAAEFIKKLIREGKDLIQFMRNFLDYLRIVLSVKMGGENPQTLGLTSEESMALKKSSQAIPGQKLLEIIKRMMEAYRDARQIPVPELPILAQIFEFSGGQQQAEKKTPSPKITEVKLETTAAVSVDIDLGTIVDRWAQVLAKIREYNHSLLSSLRLGRIVNLEGLDLILAFPYNFHKDTIEARKNKIVVEQVLEDIYGHPLKVKIFLERELSSDTAASAKNDLLDEAVKILGTGPQITN